MPPNCNHEFVEKKLRQRGWLVGDRPGKGNSCKECQDRKKGERTVVTSDKTMSAQLQKLAPEQGRPQPRPATPRETRLVYARLDAVFDEAKGQFLAGHDDRTVAKELDLPWALVAKLREDSGLVVKGDAVIIGLRQELKVLQDLIDGLTVKINELEQERKK